MASFLEQVAGSAGDYVRSLACGIENYQEFIRRVSPLGGIVPPPPSLWPLLCPDRPPPPEAYPVPPYNGGQCPEQYTIFTQVISGPNAGPPNQVGGLVGPLEYYPEPFEGIQDFRGRMFFARCICGTSPQGRVCIALGSPSPTVIDFWERTDGQPDNCGDPAPEFPIPRTPLPPGPPEDRPVTDPDGGPDINFTFAPSVGPLFVDIDGSLKIPVNVNVAGPNIFAPVNIPVNISLPDFEPTFNIGGGGGGEPGPPVSPCCEPPTVPGPEVEGDEDEPITTEPPPEGLRMYGIQVLSEVNGAVAQATVISTGADVPSLWVPRIGSVFFELDTSTEEGNSRITYSQDYDIKLANQLIVGPQNGEILRAFVRPAKGVRATAIPLFTAARN